MQLKDLKIGESALIKNLLVTGSQNRRLCEMGFLPKTELYISYKAPLGSPMSVCIRGYQVVLSSVDAKAIEVERLNEK
ncbi:MAG: ferrous iron transport protein A [Succinivibrionaceae bacterium]